MGKTRSSVITRNITESIPDAKSSAVFMSCSFYLSIVKIIEIDDIDRNMKLSDNTNLICRCAKTKLKPNWKRVSAKSTAFGDKANC